MAVAIVIACLIVSGFATDRLLGIAARADTRGQVAWPMLALFLVWIVLAIVCTLVGGYRG